MLPTIETKPLEHGLMQLSGKRVVTDEELPTGFAGARANGSGVARECGAWSNLALQLQVTSGLQSKQS